jgi:hypothetical protein
MQPAHAFSFMPPASVDLFTISTLLMERFYEILLFRSSFHFLLFHIILALSQRSSLGLTERSSIWERTQRRKRTYAKLCLCVMFIFFFSYNISQNSVAFIGMAKVLKNGKKGTKQFRYPKYKTQFRNPFVSVKCLEMCVYAAAH